MQHINVNDIYTDMLST